MPYTNVPDSLQGKMESCVEQVVAEGNDKQSAIAICYSKIVGKSMSNVVEKAKSTTHVDGVKCAGVKCDYCDGGGTFPYVDAMPGPTSLEALATARAAQAQVSAIQSATYDFGDVVRNIAASPTIDDKAAAIAAEAGVFQQMMTALSNGVTDALKALGFGKAGARHNKGDQTAVQTVHDMAVQLGAMCDGKAKSAFGVCKGLDGNYYGLGVFTNCYEDLDGEIIRSDAHKEFAQWLDANPSQAPELWTWHEPGTARKSRANWWDYDGTFFWMQWPLTEGEAIPLAKAGPLTMSHQFNGIKEGNEWIYYRSFEASVLTPGAEANPLTSFESVQKELGMFSPEKRQMFVDLYGEDYAKEKEAASDKARTLADAEGKRRKENADTLTPDTATTTTPVVPISDSIPTVDQAIVTLTDSLTKLTADVAALTGEIKAIKAAKQKEITTEAERLTAQTMQRLTSPRGPTVGIAEAAKAQGEALTPEQMKAAGVVDAVTVAAGWENAQIRRG